MTEAVAFRTIVVPFDFSDSARRALDIARSLAKSAGPAHLVLVHAYFVPVELETLAQRAHEPILELVSAQASEDLEKVLIDLQNEGISAEFLAHHRSPERLITEVASEKNADLIVMGTHGRTGLAHVLLGSVAERVLRTAPCPVITVRP
jgi:nucleotide-binding universal stress UspA family protein